MTTQLLSADTPWRTRGELLAARAAAVPSLEGRLLSGGRLALDTALVAAAALAFPLAGTSFAEGGGSGAAIGTVFALLGLVAVVLVCRKALATRALIAELGDWDAAERRGRSLPAGNVRPEHRTAWDARVAADFERVAGTAGADAYVRPWRTGLLLRAVAAGLAVGLGGVLVLVGALGADTPAAVRAAVVTGGAWALLCGLVAAVSATRLAFRWTRASAELDGEIAALRNERDGGTAPAGAMSPGRRAALLSLVALPIAAILVARVGALAGTGVAVAVGAVVVVVLAVVVAAATRSGRRTPGGPPR